MTKENKNISNGVSIGIPSVVAGVLIALKHVDMVSLSYIDIILFGFKVWIVCSAIIIVIWLICLFISYLIALFK